ncbi:MAG: tetratricopeptide repeat protein [Hyphomicrobiaceae bacterium]
MRIKAAFSAAAALVLAGTAPAASPAFSQSGTPHGDSQRQERGQAAPDPRNKDNGRSGSAPQAKAPQPIPKSLRRPGGSSIPEGGSRRAALLRELYAHLATTSDETVAQRTANAIQQVWKSGASDTVTLLVARAAKAIDDDKKLAFELLGRAIDVQPDYTEVFYNRAMLNYADGNLIAAAGDLRRVLALDENHFKALESLGQIFKETSRKKAALEVFRQLYLVYPLHSGAKGAVEELSREVEGQPS